MENIFGQKRAKTYGLVTEELSAFFTEHGFKDGRRHHIIARLVAKNDDLIIRMRDDCKPFNMQDYYQLVKDSEDVEERLSLSIIFKMAKDVKYTSTFGANNVIVRM